MGTETAQKGEPYWLVYVSLLLAGLIMLGDAYQLEHLAKWTSKIGIALTYSAFALLVGKGNLPSRLASVIVTGVAILVLVAG